MRARICCVSFAACPMSTQMQAAQLHFTVCRHTLNGFPTPPFTGGRSVPRSVRSCLRHSRLVASPSTPIEPHGCRSISCPTCPSTSRTQVTMFSRIHPRSCRQQCMSLQLPFQLQSNNNDRLEVELFALHICLPTSMTRALV